MTRPQVASRSEVARGLRASVCAATPRRGSLLYKLNQMCKESHFAFSIVFCLFLPLVSFAEDACIISDGTAETGINSGYCWGPLSRVELDFAFDATEPRQMRIIGADTDATRAKMSCYVTGAGEIAFGFNFADNNEAFSGHYTQKAADTARHVIVADQKNKKVHYITYETGVTNKTLDISGTPSVTSSIPLGLFGTVINRGLSAVFRGDNNSAKGRIYRARFFTDDVLVRDLVPLVKGGKPGFRDLVSGAFVTVDGGASLSALSANSATPVEADDGYVSTSGNNYNRNRDAARFLDTGYVPNNATRVELDYALADDYPQSGYDDGGSGHEWFLFDGFAQGRFGINYANWTAMMWSVGGTQWSYAFSPSLGRVSGNETGVRRTATLDMGNLSKPASIVTAGYTNMVASASGTSFDGLTGSQSLKISCNYDKNCFAALKIYGLKIFEGGELLRNYVPTVRDGVPGLEDVEGTGGFIASGRGKHALGWGGAMATDGATDAYLESDGTQGINTGYLMKGSCSRIECDFAFTDCTTNSTGTTNYQQRPFGQDYGSDFKSALYINGSGQFVFGFGNTFINNHGPFINADTQRHTAIIDGFHNRLYFITGSTTNSNYDISADKHSNNDTWPMGIFSTVTAQDASSWRNHAKMKLYSLRVYESDVLVHEYLPYCTSGVACLYDTVDKAVLSDARGGNAFSLGGMGVEGSERWVKTPHGFKMRKTDLPGTLVASAIGAKSYRWTKNGQPIEGGENGELAVEWEKGGKTDVYSVAAVYDVYGTETVGSPLFANVYNVPNGLKIVLF